MNREETGDSPVGAEEREFTAYLQRRSLITPHGHEDAQPSADLDDQVLRAAHEAIAASPPRRLPLTRWAIPGTLAAAVLISFAFMMHAGMQGATGPQISSTARTQTQPLREPAPSAALDAAPPSASLNAAPSARRQRLQKPAQPESDPQSWLAQIEVLRAQGKQQQADAQLQRLHAAFPDFPIHGMGNTDTAAKRAAPADRTPK